MPQRRLPKLPFRHFPEHELHRLVGVTLARLDLRHAAGSRLDHRHRNHPARVVTHLRHPELSSNQPVRHFPTTPNQTSSHAWKRRGWGDPNCACRASTASSCALQEHWDHPSRPALPPGYSLISTSTPAAKFNFISASIVSGVGSMISNSRL